MSEARTYTINTVLCLEKNLKARLAILKELETSCAKRSRWLQGDKVDEPTYDVKEVDKKIVKLQKALFNIDLTLKTVNARTKVELTDFDYDDLMSAIEG